MNAISHQFACAFNHVSFLLMPICPWKNYTEVPSLWVGNQVNGDVQEVSGRVGVVVRCGGVRFWLEMHSFQSVLF